MAGSFRVGSGEANPGRLIARALAGTARFHAACCLRYHAGESPSSSFCNPYNLTTDNADGTDKRIERRGFGAIASIGGFSLSPSVLSVLSVVKMFCQLAKEKPCRNPFADSSSPFSPLPRPIRPYTPRPTRLTS